VPARRPASEEEEYQQLRNILDIVDKVTGIIPRGRVKGAKDLPRTQGQ
jgi:hypothetical protein